MAGVITRWDILAHPAATIRCFGWIVFFRAVLSPQGKTFLSILQEAGLFKGNGDNAPEVLKHCVLLELRAKRIYRALATAFAHFGPEGAFFAHLAEQEQDHADLLEICRSAVLRGGWKTTQFEPWEKYLPILDRRMDEAEAAIYHIDSLEVALQLVIQLEASEINHVFCAALTASDSTFVRRIEPFREAMEAHMDYMMEWIPELSPQLELDVGRLRTTFPGIKHGGGQASDR